MSDASSSGNETGDEIAVAKAREETQKEQKPTRADGVTKKAKVGEMPQWTFDEYDNLLSYLLPSLQLLQQQGALLDPRTRTNLDLQGKVSFALSACTVKTFEDRLRSRAYPNALTAIADVRRILATTHRFTTLSQDHRDLLHRFGRVLDDSILNRDFDKLKVFLQAEQLRVQSVARRRASTAHQTTASSSTSSTGTTSDHASMAVGGGGGDDGDDEADSDEDGRRGDDSGGGGDGGDENDGDASGTRKKSSSGGRAKPETAAATATAATASTTEKQAPLAAATTAAQTTTTTLGG
ncbi:hypothetical protein PTSG_08072 [Salpingoeca rosetta]|uniref:Uncharacterized protein n=1 Tax=Salpingoeca rosetta (strain ATCC 50818 / BSB-021) TaxID=946362 RepID=F2UHX2_SALR5|nr:uncharacterized protein PTSG_08072 [Salpingoeca rosetta]EGD76721.1 hypothetical protein PTSG_08072 [Salpingoeca rosetta]|eukprot:XP_004991093.1 hypothetical protein PTSG_08072 [Salpingoeca rosetta]